MPIPTYQDAMTPLLRVLSDGSPKHIRDISQIVTNGFDLTDEERERKLPSGQDTYVGNRIGWARTYLYKTKLIERTGERGVYRITQRELDSFKNHPERLITRCCDSFPSLANG